MLNNNEFIEEIPLNQRFGFGKNWSKFIDSQFDESRVTSSIDVIKNFTDLSDFSGLTFVDVGSGSGIHSLAAHRLNAKNILSFDFDPFAVSTTSRLRAQESNSSNWIVEKGSVLDQKFIKSLGQFDFVYSWGVLHHTGSVWDAITNTCSLVSPGGKMYLALYSLDVQPNAEYWLKIKKKYVTTGFFMQRLMEQAYLYNCFYGKSLWKYVSHKFKKESGRARGMELMTDVRDWLGGWPMEFVYDKDVEKFVSKKGFYLEKIKKGEACTEFLFSKTI